MEKMQKNAVKELISINKTLEKLEFQTVNVLTLLYGEETQKAYELIKDTTKAIHITKRLVNEAKEALFKLNDTKAETEL